MRKELWSFDGRGSCFLGGSTIWGRWGRKDCFPGADGNTIIQPNENATNATTIPIYGADGNTKLIDDGTGYKKIDISVLSVLDNNNSQIYTIKNPLTFVCNGISPYDWYTNTGHKNDELWTYNNKSTYDPCPNGWQVPQDGTWNDFTIENTPSYIQGDQISSGSQFATNGRLYKIMDWYPSTGRRSYGSGSFYRVGDYGYYWSASVSGTFAKYLVFTMSGVYLGYTDSRAYGLSVRCVQE